ncbi:MAG: hypothetical protein Q4C03_01855, partial [bacterium]|nr:hypothetical protein [bacterium]
MLHFIRSLLTKDPATPETDPILDPCPVDYVLDALEKVSRAMARAADSRGFELTLEESRRFHALCGE